MRQIETMRSRNPVLPGQPPAEHGRDDYRPKWLRLYFVLAAFDVLIVCASLFLNHQISLVYQDSIEANRLWANRLATYEKLRELAQLVNAPGNDVFDSRDVTREQVRLIDAHAEFKRAMDMAGAEVAQPESDVLVALGNDLNAVTQAMNAMVARPI